VKNITNTGAERERERERERENKIRICKSNGRRYMMLYQCNYDKNRHHWSLSIAHENLHHVEIMSERKIL